MDKIVNVGIFWVVFDKLFRQQIIEIKKSYYASQADSAGFVNYPYSHFEMWDEVGAGKTNDCYKYPRGRVLYDANKDKYRIYADKCIDGSTIEEVAEIFDIDSYELCWDEHYVCDFCRQSTNTERWELSFKILRGQDKIGENLIDIKYGKTKVLVELGKSLSDDGDRQIEQAVLNTEYSAVIVSHYHEDHAGLIRLKRDCPVYVGKGAYRVIRAMGEYHGEEMPSNVKTYGNRCKFNVGDISITPYLCDHSAYDSYMLLFEAGGQSILYTGDFRFHGRKSKEILLAALPKNVDVLIHEGTNQGKNVFSVSETELENKAVEIMRTTEGPVFVLQSGTNLDRLVSIYRASKRSGRILYMDNYSCLIASSAGGSIPRPDVFNDVYAFTPRLLSGKRKDMFFEIENKRGLKLIASKPERFTMLVRQSMLGYLKRLFQIAQYGKGTLIYSIWSGYKGDESTRDFINQIQAMGVKVVDLHASGHAREEDILLLKQVVNAKQTICVHTDRQSNLF